MMNTNKFKLLLLCIAIVNTVSAQDMWTYFSPDDFARRRAKLMEQIGDGVAIMQGAELPEAFVKFRQDNNFYYLTGVEMPGAVLIIDGKAKTSLLFVPDKIPGDIKEEARIVPAAASASLYKMDAVRSLTAFTGTLNHYALLGQPFYLISSPEETTEMTRDRGDALRVSRMNDPWDERLPKEVNFIHKIKERYPLVAVKDLTPVLDMMRWVKDEKEIKVIRECGRIGALGFDEAMRVTRPGIYEYQVVAACDFVYQNEGTQGPAYFAIAASGERGLSWHYNANNHLLKEGDVILLDYAPDHHYYTTDITRTWPVADKFSDVQLKYYNCIREAEEKVIAAMKPGVTVNDLKKIAKDVYIKHGYEKLWLDYIGHFVGMAVHDVGPYDKPFVAGVVFNVEPIIEDKDLKIHLRLEDTIVTTATGSENLTAGTTVIPEQIYKLMKEKGVGEKTAF
ncbi:MAG TPA: Xaa-Pro peptidase family protein [Chitinophagaceae bacterium]|nr:Xaa-Pro peptidase family protein [Chitinophagaceae bacterium]